MPTTTREGDEIANDLLMKNGRIIDGSGRLGFRADGKAWLESLSTSGVTTVLRRRGMTRDPRWAQWLKWRDPHMRYEAFSFGSIRIDGVTYDHDVVIDRGEVRKRKKKPSKKFRDQFGHTPLSVEEKIPWKCRRLVVGTGTGALPVMNDVKLEAIRRRIELLIFPTAQAIEALRQAPADTNAILHVTC